MPGINRRRNRRGACVRTPQRAVPGQARWRASPDSNRAAEVVVGQSAALRRYWVQGARWDQRLAKEIMDTTVIFAPEVPAATISDRMRRGQLVRLATGVYTTDVTSDRAVVVLREWHLIVGRMFPRAVITDRSAITGGPVGGRLYLSHDGRNREVPLPGLTVLVRAGAGPLDDDIALPGGLYQASKGRGRLLLRCRLSSRGVRGRGTRG
jgi:hypothetical protein